MVKETINVLVSLLPLSNQDRDTANSSSKVCFLGSATERNVKEREVKFVVAPEEAARNLRDCHSSCIVGNVHTRFGEAVRRSSTALL